MILRSYKIIRKRKLVFCTLLAVTFLFYILLNGKVPDFVTFRELWHPPPIRKSQALSESKSFIIPATQLKLPTYKAKRVDCVGLFSGNEESVLNSERRDEEPQKNMPTDFKFISYYNLNKNCDKFLALNRYILHTPFSEEVEFPLAYSIVMFKSVSQFERLFRAIYRPWNYYCIHVDIKSPHYVMSAVKAILQCLPESNVILLNDRVDVQWGAFSLLEADIRCFNHLLHTYRKWKYLINLTGQEFPLRTNLELVRILKSFNGANNVEGTFKRRNEERIPTNYLPFRITWFKGSVHILASRAFIKYMLTDEKSLQIMDSLKEGWVPDETFFSTLNHNPNVLKAPGSYLGEPETDQSTYYFIARLKNWGDYPFNYPCMSEQWVRQICIWGRRDLPFINSRFELFINKLYWDFQPSTLDCLEERYYNFTNDDYHFNAPQINRPYPLSFYKNLSFVKNHV